MKYLQEFFSILEKSKFAIWGTRIIHFCHGLSVLDFTLILLSAIGWQSWQDKYGNHSLIK